VLGGVVALMSEDLDDLGSGLEEAAAFADGLEPAVEIGRAAAVTVPKPPALALGSAHER
jgi:hypothetical protein